MTDEQMKQRMQEITRQRNELAIERQKYENYFAEKKHLESVNQHKNDVGKYFKMKNLYGNKNAYIKGFKIIELDEKNERYAKCLVLINGFRNTCWNEVGILVMTIGLWSNNDLRLISGENDKKLIDFYEECSKEDFFDGYESYIEMFEKYL